jgi:hypothetical protein
MKNDHRFMNFVNKIQVSINGCWQWIGCIDMGGYGRIMLDKKNRPAHRVSYEMHHLVKVPEDMTLDHLCRNPTCVNPWHLEIVTMRENMLRGNTIAAVAIRENKCMNGHEFTSENTMTNKTTGGRRCRECYRNYQRDYQRVYQRERRALLNESTAS